MPVIFLERGTKIVVAIKYLCARCVVHRDIKPTNLLLSAELLHLCHCDFCLATKRDETTGAHRSPICGTPNYVGPEFCATSGGKILTAAAGLYKSFRPRCSVMILPPYDEEKVRLPNKKQDETLTKELEYVNC